MKTKSQLSVVLGLMALILFMSCSKKENNPSQVQKSAAKSLPALIDSREQYALLSQFPSFPGGDSLFMEYLKTHIRLTPDAAQNNIRGKVFASFIVETDGSISNAEILRGIGYGCDDQVTAALRDMPAWTAGKIGPDKVRVKMVIPVEFK